MNTTNYLSHLSVDNVIFGYHNKQLKVLLTKLYNNDMWMLPGGFIKDTESILDAAKRVACERTGLKDLYLKQYKSYGEPKRTFDTNITVNEEYYFDGKKSDIINDYFVSISFYTLTEFSKVNITKSEIDQDCQWFNLEEVPELLYDHSIIFEDAVKALRFHVDYFPIGMKLLGNKFTMPEIQSLYETILDKKIDRRNFSKKILKSGILIKLDEQRKIGAHRSPNLYSFNVENYTKALESGVGSFF